jgi:release factor glutamine methyltransferase
MSGKKNSGNAQKRVAISVERTVEDLVRKAGCCLDLPDIYLLLGKALNKTKEFLLTYPQYSPPTADVANWEELKKRRLDGEPAAYITGEKEFYSLTFKVNRHTLIPRPETEMLVDAIISCAPESLLDIGTGAGNIAISVQKHLENCNIVATDSDCEALKCARENAESILGSQSIQFILSDFFKSLPSARFDVITSNPPYIRRNRIRGLQREVRMFEPIAALDGGEHGIDAYEKLLDGAWRYLTADGAVILETDPDVVHGVCIITGQKGYRIERIEKDYTGDERMIVLTHPDCGVYCLDSKGTK